MSLVDRSTAGSPATRERTRSGRTRLSIPWCETLSGLESAQPRAPPGAAAGVGRMRRSLPTLRGRRVSSRPGPADPAGALAAVIAERQQHTSIPGPGGARRSSGPACRSPRSGRYRQPQSSADWRWSLTSWPANNALTLNVQFTSTRPYPAVGPPVGHDARLAPTAISAVLRGCWPDSDQVAGRPDTDILRGEPVGLGSLVCSWVRPVPRWRLCLPRIPAMGVG